MEASVLVELAKGRADDVAGAALYSDASWLQWAAEAEEEACIRGRLLFDDSSAFTRIQLVEGRNTYRLDHRIDYVDSARITRQGASPRDVSMVGVDVIKCEVDRSGSPRLAAQVEKTIRIWPTPDAHGLGTLCLSVYRLPLNPIEDASDEPEIAQEHHVGLVDWMMFRAFSQKDSEKEDLVRADRALFAFEQRFGRRRDADTLRRHRERRRVTTRYGGY
jgi:hypothetical protein